MKCILNLGNTIIDDLALDGLLLHYHYFLAKMSSILLKDPKVKEKNRIKRILRYSINHERIITIVNNDYSKLNGAGQKLTTAFDVIYGVLPWFLLAQPKSLWSTIVPQ